MTELVRCSVQSAQLTRIEKVLEYIHQHLFLPLSLDDIAQKSCWSRWQLQRVFTAKTGVNVAQYIRELKLSRAAESLLDSPSERVIDIALSFGFNSEISFSRSFKQFFGCSPREYRKRGIRSGLRQPITSISFSSSDVEHSPSTPSHLSFTQIRIEYKAAFSVAGYRGEISGLFSSQPDFQQAVPEIWRAFDAVQQSIPTLINTEKKRYGVIDTLSLNSERLHYWAAEELQTATFQPLNTLEIPTQQYAVLPHKGPIDGLKDKLEWLFTHWLPQSGYRGVDGFELEIYPENYQMNSADAYMEYWLPIE
ncbi:MAG TPA: AraC family transcriptional regulator [Vibrio sp.]|uniref:AraC family transcriptional regulator n=1 Tax=Vibrio TaxID=662 RepID=UPI0003FDCF1B|nr:MULTISPECIES: AraC family transcriptional regulator [Vibrio]HCH02784.1 AraC family transcriptional regulator [Vibrio sp.]